MNDYGMTKEDYMKVKYMQFLTYNRNNKLKKMIKHEHDLQFLKDLKQYILSDQGSTVEKNKSVKFHFLDEDSKLNLLRFVSDFRFNKKYQDKEERQKYFNKINEIINLINNSSNDYPIDFYEEELKKRKLSICMLDYLHNSIANDYIYLIGLFGDKNVEEIRKIIEYEANTLYALESSIAVKQEYPELLNKPEIKVLEYTRYNIESYDIKKITRKKH